MPKRIRLVSLFLCPLSLLLAPRVAEAQHPPLPERGPAPLLHVRFIGPAGMKATIYAANGPARTFDTPVVVGLRPGYAYPVQLSGGTELPGVALYPSLEVIGTLQLPPKLSAADFPAPIVFSREDIDHALAGAFITKVVYLEHPDQASSDASRPNQPFEMQAEPGQDPVNAARAVGRPLVIIRFGGREVSPQDLAREAIPGTVLLPGEKTLVPPPLRPSMPWACVPLIDPILGRRLTEEECLFDGGDTGPSAGIGPDGKLHGLDPSDAVAEYTAGMGRRHVKPSNRVSICVPRFAVIRTATAAAGLDAAVVMGAARNAVAHSHLEARLPSKVAMQTEQVESVRARQRPSAAVAQVGLHDIEQVQANALIVGMMQGQAVVGTCLKTPEEKPDRLLVLTKTVDKQTAQIGDVITFNLKYSNPGGQPITNLAVSDSLTSRLEYASGSARSDRDATFTIQPNSAGSVILRWEVAGRLLSGESGVVTFQARVR